MGKLSGIKSEGSPGLHEYAQRPFQDKILLVMWFIRKKRQPLDTRDSSCRVFAYICPELKRLHSEPSGQELILYYAASFPSR